MKREVTNSCGKFAHFHCIMKKGESVHMKKKVQSSISSHSTKQPLTPQKKQKMDPKLLRLMVIFPNILSYFLLFGLIVFTFTQYAELKAAGNLWFWLVTTAVLAFMSVSTTWQISKKLKAGTL